MYEITVDELFNHYDDYLIIDVRSELEFQESSIEGAVNLPILNNEERHLVGKTYKQNQADAYRMGLEIGTKKLTVIYDEVLRLMEQHKKEKVLFYCFRGGTRSKSVHQTLSLLKLKSYQLIGGIKAYRRYILDHLEPLAETFDYILLAGNTGCGKTKYLKRLKELGYPVIDLEGLANNRGSIFGSVGLGKPINQKQFDSTLYFELLNYQNQGVQTIILESEGKKIGNVLIPTRLFDKMKQGQFIQIDSSYEKRVENIKEDYLNVELNMDRIIHLIEENTYFKERLGKQWCSDLKVFLLDGDMNAFIKVLLIDYYDKLYSHSRESKDILKRITSDDEEVLVTFIKDFYESYQA